MIVVVAAVLAIAWLGVSYGNARSIRHAQVAAADPHASPAQIESALRGVRSAHTLDPSRTESLSYVAALEIRAGRLDDAARVYEEIVRQEPDTAEAWFVLSRLTLPGALYLGLIALLPSVAFIFLNANQNFPFGGTSILIIVGVGLDTVKQIESQLQQRNYEGFLR